MDSKPSLANQALNLISPASSRPRLDARDGQVLDNLRETFQEAVNSGGKGRAIHILSEMILGFPENTIEIGDSCDRLVKRGYFPDFPAALAHLVLVGINDLPMLEAIGHYLSLAAADPGSLEAVESSPTKSLLFLAKTLMLQKQTRQANHVLAHALSIAGDEDRKEIATIQGMCANYAPARPPEGAAQGKPHLVPAPGFSAQGQGRLPEPGQAGAEPGQLGINTDKSRTLHGVRLAIVNSLGNKFDKMYQGYFSTRNDVKVVHPKDAREIQEAADWAEIIWSTWCNEPAVILSQSKHKALFVTHIRSYEILTPQLMQNVSWPRVGGAIFVAEHIRQIANEMWPQHLQGVEQRTINNFVILDQHRFWRGRPGFNIGYIGYLNHKKGVGLLLQCIREAVRIDPRYQLHIAGEFQETRFEVYMRHLIGEMGLAGNVVFHGWVKDLDSFLEGMNYTISTSPWEGCPNNVIESMAAGLKPIIHNWRGAKQLFPPELVFNDLAEFTGILRSPRYDSDAYRQWVAERFNADRQLPLLEEFLAGCLARHRQGRS